MKRLIVILAILLAVATAAARPVVWPGGVPAGAASVDRLARSGASADSVRIALDRLGYLDATVSLSGDSMTIDPGVPVLLDTLIVKRDSVSWSLAIDAPFSEQTVSALTDSLLNIEYARGNWYAAIDVDRMERFGVSVNLFLTVRPGPNLTIHRIDLRGLVRTQPTVVEHYLPISTGDTLTPERVAAVERAAERIEFVKFAPPATILPRPGYTSADLALEFREQRPLTIEAGGGYIPNDTSSQFVWHLNARFNNLFGGGRQARLLSERREEGRQLLQIGYSQPLFVLGDGRLESEVATRDYRDAFYEFGARTGISTRLAEDITGGAELGFRRVEPADNAPSYSAYRVSFHTEWDRLDNAFNPATGVRFGSSLGYAYRRYDADSSISAVAASYNETRADARADLYRPILGRFIGHVGLQYHGLETSEALPPLAELILVGGPGSLRGYRNEQFAVLRTALFTFEPRWRFDSGYLFAFYDGAYLNNRIGMSAATAHTDEAYRYGYGLGLGLSDSRRSVKLSLGWNPELAYDQPRLSIELSSDI